MSRSEIIGIDQIFNMTDGGYDIFQNELGSIPTKNISSPLRTGDNNPSFKVFKNNHLYFFKDYGGDQDSGNAIQFVQKRYSLSFGEAIQKVIQDLGLKQRVKNYIPTVKKDPITQKSYRLIEFDDCPFDKSHAAYWDKIHLPEGFLRSRDIYRVKTWAVDKVIQKKLDGELTFAYYAPDINGVKILRINVPSEMKWKNNIPNNYLWSYYKYENPVENLFVIKSRKDELIYDYLGYNTVSIQSEDAKVLLTHNVEKINKLSKHPILALGTDLQGMETSMEIMNVTHWNSFNIKVNVCKKHNINDPAGFVEIFNLNQFNNLIKLKLQNGQKSNPLL